MKAPHLLETSATLCAVVALTGCATPEPQIVLYTKNTTVLPQAALPHPTESSTPAAMPAPSSSGLDVAGSGDPSESRPFEPGPDPMGNYSTLGGKADVGTRRIEFERKEPKRSGLYLMLGDTDTTSGPEFSWERTVFRQPGLRLLSIHF